LITQQLQLMYWHLNLSTIGNEKLLTLLTACILHRLLLFENSEAAYLTLPARLLMETRLICMGTSVAASVCSSSSGAVRLGRSSRCTISAALHTSVSLSEICKSRTRQLPAHCRTADWCTLKMPMLKKLYLMSVFTAAVPNRS